MPNDAIAGGVYLVLYIDPIPGSLAWDGSVMLLLRAPRTSR